MAINWRTVQRIYETLLAPFLRLGEWLDDRRCAQEWPQGVPWRVSTVARGDLDAVGWD